MNDAKPVVKQVKELQIIVHEMEVEGMGINSNFLVGSIIEKLPQSWKNFKLYLKHLTDDMSFEQLVLKIRVEEDNKMNEKADANSLEPNANMVGESSSKSKSYHKNKGKIGDGFGQKYSKDGKKDYTKQKNNNFKKVYHCWVCGKSGHKAKDCRHKKEHGCGNSGGNSNQANHVESPKEFAGVTGSFLTTNVVDWWLDTGGTKHICNSRRMFVSYQKVNESKPMFMGNGTASKIEGKGKVVLKLTSGNDLVLSNVLHVRNITNNLISSPILSNKGFKIVFESDKFVITKGGVYVGKGYLDEGLFKLSVVTDDNVIKNNNAGTSTASVYMIDPYSLWHSRLGHVNFCSLQRMMNLGMLPKCSKDKISNKFCYMYLINTKDEALNTFKTNKAEVENQLDKKIKILRSDRGGEYESNVEVPHQHLSFDMNNLDLLWGCLAKVQIPLPKRTKLGPKTVDCVYLGPAKNSAAYRIKRNIFSYPRKDNDKQLSQDKQTTIPEIPQEKVNQEETEFLNGDLDEEIYMQQPEGFVVKGQDHKTLKKFEHYDDRPVVTPFDPKVQLKMNKGQSVSQLHYTQVLGSLMYIINCTRPDLAYSVSRLSRYSHNPGKDNWDALVRVLQYLKHTMTYGLHYTKYPLVLEGYRDANWISNHNEGKSTSGYVFMLGGVAVSWKSSKQTVNTRSTMKAEFVALDKAAEEAKWLSSFLEGIPLWPKRLLGILRNILDWHYLYEIDVRSHL
ncbi:pol polyprotein [Tanacetum coccineum]